ncbi:hypothetical protein LTR40_013017, partial [Exophiala xenobiotica]
IRTLKQSTWFSALANHEPVAILAAPQSQPLQPQRIIPTMLQLAQARQHELGNPRSCNVYVARPHPEARRQQFDLPEKAASVEPEQHEQLHLPLLSIVARPASATKSLVLCSS